MPGARDVVTNGVEKPTKPARVFKRGGTTTNVEKNFVAQFLQDQPKELTTAQVTSLSKVLRRSKEAVRNLVEEARDNFAASANFYVDVHKQATAGAFETGDFEYALKGSQWAIEHLGMEGVRIIDKATTQPSGNKIMIGIRIGGVDAAKEMDMPETVVEVVPVE